MSEFNSSLLGVTISRIKPPRRLGFDAALRRARTVAPEAEFTRNDLYSRTPIRYRTAGEGCGAGCEAFKLTAWTSQAGSCPVAASIGVIDTGVDVSHPSLKTAKITTRTFRGRDRAASGLEHGTAVVSLLVGDPASKVAGVVPQARIFAADAFHKTRSGDSADTFDLVGALDWLIAERARIINLSMSGPDNDVLKKAIEKALARDVVIVAAAGRPDDGRRKGFPGRYEGVIAVSAVDVRLRSSRMSARGEHVAFAAPGVGVNVAAPGGRSRLVDGTSFAAPFVAAAFAIGFERTGVGKEVEKILANAARDLGASGRDPIYGWGLIQYANLARCGI